MSFKRTSWGRKMMAESWGKATNRSTQDVMAEWRHDDMMKELRSQRLSSSRYRARRTHRRHREARFRASRSNESYALRGAVEKFERSTGVDWPFSESKGRTRSPSEVDQPHPKHPNVVITPDGMWRPADGYTWVNREQAQKGTNYKVKEISLEESIDTVLSQERAKEKAWEKAIAEQRSQLAPDSSRKPDKKKKPSAQKNRPHPKYANVLIRPNGNLTPAPGYTWVDPKTSGYDVKAIEQIPHVIYSGGNLTPEAGYVWLERGHKVIAIDEIANIRQTRDGHLIPDDGYTWVDPDALGKGVKAKEEESLAEAIGCLLFMGIAAAIGYYFMN